MYSSETMNTSFFFLVYAMFPIIPAQPPESKYLALIFQSSSRVIYGTWPTDQTTESLLTSYTITCAASDHVQEDFMAQKSLERKSLFVENTDLQSNIQKETFQFHICDEPFQLSAAFYWPDQTMRFGYEVYYDKERFKHFKPSKYKDYASMSQLLSRKKAWKKKHSFNCLKLSYSLADEVKLGFMWITKVTIKFNLKRWFPQIIRYLASRVAERTLRPCGDYQMSAEYYKNTDIDSFYTADSQREIFKNLDTASFSRHINCETQCLSKWQLIPANHLSLDAAAPRTCSNMTTVPIWTSITKAPLDTLTAFIQALIRVLDSNVHLFIGAERPLALKGNHWYSTETPHTVYLHKERKKIPIPTVLYYLINYTLPSCNILQSCEYSIIVVVKNDPRVDTATSICPQEEDTCRKLGWDKIHNFENVYCCEATRQTLLQVGIPENELFHSNAFNLRDIAVNRNGVIRNENIEKLVTKEIKLILKEVQQQQHATTSR